ncbi:BatD family protein [Aliikangiella sp. IMCC44359]|uniref:BatD family protein n=1 Tax=Aliikangiella sp. IMCC44359 TaxID=3459125 RepID=UPI00403AB726
MQPIKIFFQLILICTLLVANHAFAKTTASIDRTDISAGETFVLDIRIDFETDAQPDLSLIPEEFTIVSNSQYQNIQIINNKRSIIKGWKLKLKTMQTGPITLPSITVGNEQTQPIKLNIKDTSNELNLNGQAKTIFLESSVDQESPYVQQQVIFNVTLYRAVNTHYASLTEPTAGNSVVEKLGDDIQFEKQINNRRYVVTQRKYVIFPQQSGDLTISSVNFTADVNDSSRRNSNSFFNSTRPVSISTKPIKLSVRPKPVSAPTPWIPAQDVILADKWTPNSLTLKVGEPITWTLLLTVQGLSESQLPEIEVPKVDGLQWYNDAPQKERQLNDKGIIGQRVEKLAVIPSKEGTITIPEISLQWWDISSDSIKTAKIPSRQLTILPADQKAQTSTIAVPPQPTPVTILETQENNDTQVKFWQFAFAAALVLWVITLLAYLKKQGQPTSKKPQAKVSQFQNDNDKAIYNDLCRSLKSENIQKIESQLIQWLSAIGHPEIRSLGALISKVKHEKLKTKLQSIESCRYSAQQQDEIIPLNKSDLEQILKDITNQQKTAASSSIPPLYPR